MTKLANWLRRWPVILVFLGLLLLTAASFIPVRQAVDGAMLDMIFSGSAARERVSELTADQRLAHFWGTVINDTVFPFAYAGLFAGLAARFASGKRRAIVILPAFLAAAVDLLENWVQVLALSDAADILAAKTVLTPLKFALVLAAIILAAALAAANLLRRDRTALSGD